MPPTGLMLHVMGLEGSGNSQEAIKTPFHLPFHRLPGLQWVSSGLNPKGHLGAGPGWEGGGIESQHPRLPTRLSPSHPWTAPCLTHSLPRTVLILLWTALHSWPISNDRGQKMSWGCGTRTQWAFALVFPQSTGATFACLAWDLQ